MFCKIVILQCIQGFARRKFVKQQFARSLEIFPMVPYIIILNLHNVNETP